MPFTDASYPSERENGKEWQYVGHVAKLSDGGRGARRWQPQRDAAVHSLQPLD